MTRMDQLVVAIAATAELTGTVLSETALRLMAEDLAAYSEPDVSTALVRCRRELTGRLTLSAVLERLPNQPPGAEQAWAMAVQAGLWDEGATVVIERAIFTAFPYALWPDRVAARMAFIEAYPERLRKFGGEMFVSLGWDREGRRGVLLDAVRCGRIPGDHALQVMPELAADVEAILPAAPANGDGTRALGPGQ